MAEPLRKPTPDEDKPLFRAFRGGGQTTPDRAKVHAIAQPDVKVIKGDKDYGAADLNNAENNPDSFVSNVSGTTSKSVVGSPKKSVLSFLKKKGPMGAILAALLGGVFSLAVLFSPGIAVVQLKEIMVGDLNDQLAAVTKFSDELWVKKVSGSALGGQVASVCSNVIDIRCKFGSISKSMQSKLEKAGITVDFDSESSLPGRAGKISKMTFSDGTEVSSPTELRNALRNNTVARSAIRRAYNPKFYSLSDTIADKVFRKYKTNKSRKVKGVTTEEQLNSINENTKGATVSSNQGYLTDSEGRRYVVDENGSRVYESDSRFNTISEQNASKGTAVASEAGSAKSNGTSVASSTLKNGMSGAARALLVTGILDSACTAYNGVRALSAGAKAVRSQQLAQYATVFLNVADRIKASEAEDTEVETIGDILMAIDSDKTVTNEFSLSGSDINNPIVTEVDNPYYGKNAFDSAGYKVAAYNDAPTLTARDQLYTIGGGLSGTLDGSLNTIKSMIGADIQATCGTVQSWWFRIGSGVAGIALGVVSGGGTIIGQVAASAGIGITLGAVMSYTQAALTDIVAGTTVTANTNGPDSGNAIFSGVSAILGGIAMTRGMTPGNTSTLQSYTTVQTEVKNEYIATETYEAQETPFDIYNQYSFLGSFVRKINPTIISSSSTISKIASIVSSGFSSIIPKTNAASEFNPNRFSSCEDEGYQELGIDADVFCNVRYVMTDKQLNMDSIEALDWMISNGYINQTSGEPISGTDYDKWITNCTERVDGWGESSDPDSNNDDWATGKKCMESSDTLDYFSVYYMYKTINDSMEDEETNTNTSTNVNITGTGEFSHPCPQCTVITDYYGTRGGNHLGVDFAGGSDNPIYAAADGVVQIANSGLGGSGNWVVIKHDNDVYTSYMHLRDLPMVNEGDTVVKGQQIGIMGTTGDSTGPHLHFQVGIGGYGINTVDPLGYLDPDIEGN